MLTCQINDKLTNGRMENAEKKEKWNDRRDFNFPHLCLVGGWKCGGIENFFFLVEKKNERIENKICINLLI